MDFAALFSFEGLFTLLMLVILQAVLGFDNLLYISLESQRVEESRQAQLRKMGIGIAVLLRIVMLFLLLKLIDAIQGELFHFNNSIISGSFNFHSIVVLFGGAFILYTAVKEISHMLVLEEAHGAERETRSYGQALFMIVAMNLVFSFDSILSAIALTDVFIIMAIAILIGGALMIWLADRVTEFLQKNRMYEVVGLFILFLVGVLLLSEGGHLAHLHLFGKEITAMSKATFYFVIVILVVIDLVQSRYQKKLMALKQAAHGPIGSNKH